MVFPTSSGYLSLSAKAALMFTGVLSIAVILKYSVPVVAQFAVSALPVMYSSVVSWLQPPYLYLLINCIIISIVASSKLQLHGTDRQTSSLPVLGAVQASEKVSNVIQSHFVSAGVSDYDYSSINQEDNVVEKAANDNSKVVESDGCGDILVSSRRVQNQKPLRSDSMELLMEKLEETEKPQVSKRFGHKKSGKATSEGGKAAALGVSKQRRHDTLESTWKTITEGRSMPLARHLKKSDTWNSQTRRDTGTTNVTATNPASLSSPPPPPSKMEKSQTFEENKTRNGRQPSPQGSGKLRRERSLSQEELNRRVEAFIKKFNEEMRLQRQESESRFQEMISTGAY